MLFYIALDVKGLYPFRISIPAWHLGVGISGNTMQNPRGPSEWQGSGIVPAWLVRPALLSSGYGIPVPSFYIFAKNSA